MIDWIFSWFDQLAESLVWNAILSQLKWVDWFAGLFLVLGIIYGIKNGFMAEIAEIMELTVVIFFVFEYDDWLAVLLKNHVKWLPGDSVPVTSFILLAAAVWLTVGLTVRYLKKLVHAEVVKSIKMIGGAVLGGFHLLLIFSFISQAIILLPSAKLRKVYEQGVSYSGYMIAQLAPTVHKVLAEPIHQLQSKS